MPRFGKWKKTLKVYGLLTIANIFGIMYVLIHLVFWPSLIVLLLCVAVLFSHGLVDFLRAPIGFKDTPKEGFVALAADLALLTMILSLISGGVWWALDKVGYMVDRKTEQIDDPFDDPEKETERTIQEAARVARRRMKL